MIVFAALLVFCAQRISKAPAFAPFLMLMVKCTIALYVVAPKMVMSAAL
jgi:hypothetical protein